MNPNHIEHFLVVYNIPEARADVLPFGADYEAAVEAYADLEQQHRDDPRIEVVLLGSDSVDTLKRTHSSYFELSERHIDQIVARELEQAGLR